MDVIQTYGNSVDFLTFQKGHNQRSLNELLSANYPDLFIIQAQKNPSSPLPPLLYYKVPGSRRKLRVFFLPLRTRHTQQNIPVIGVEEAEPKRQSIVPIPPLLFILYLQMHGWVWNINRLLKTPLNQNARTKGDNFAHDICALLPWAVKKHLHFDWLAEEFSHRLLDAANRFVQGHPGTLSDWRALGVSVEAPKPHATNSGKRPTVRYEESKKGNQATRLLREQLGDLEYVNAHEYDDDQYISDYMG
ncbi:hypothetical protein FRC10_006366 [Ceratobasidium sp. 414]|nr:hypothetical protein FRC10_006366 [Ceratobasidium sp. 414]